MQKTKIQWADYSWNPAVGCSKVSAGCANCYAETMVHRFPWMTGIEMRNTDNWIQGAAGGAPGSTRGFYSEPDIDEIGIGWDGRAHFKPKRLEEPFHLRSGKDRPHRIFVCSMSDLFHESLTNEEIAAVFGVMAATPQHQYVVLTKRLRRAVEWFTWISCESKKADLMTDTLVQKCTFQYTKKLPLHRIKGTLLSYYWPLNNVIICASVENQNAADERIPILLQIPARWRGVSIEPMLEHINLGLLGTIPKSIEPRYKLVCERLNWVICGCESGPGSRECKEDWVRSLKDQCVEAGVPFFLKQLIRNGIRISNPELDGRVWNDFAKQ